MASAAPKRLSFAEREALILDAAGQLFSRWGYRGTTTRAIAEAAGVNEALLFRHFSTKEKLYDALLNQALFEWSQEVLPELEDFRSLPLEKALIKIGRTIMDRSAQDSRMIRTMAYASLEDHRLGKLFFEKRLPLRDFLESFFREKQRAGEVKLNDVAMLSRTYLSLIFHYINMKEIFGVDNFYPRGKLATLKFFVRTLLKGAAP